MTENTKLLAPNFVICGAMKSGTTSLHEILNRHEDIFIPDKEVHFFDKDNIIQHPDFFCHSQGCWTDINSKGQFEQDVQWYNAMFSGANEGQLRGEDSTTYLTSPLAIRRLVKANPDVKLLVMLRHPTARAYSQYWHLVRTGRMSYTFEQAIQYAPEQVLSRSMYLEQLKAMLEEIPLSQVKVIQFEHFTKNVKVAIEEVLQFLNLESDKLPPEAYTLIKNKAKLPRWVWLQRMKNHWFRGAANISYRNHFSTEQQSNNEHDFIYERVVNKVHSIINPLTEKTPATMKPESKAFLDEFFARHLSGLDELLDGSFEQNWFNKNTHVK